MSKLRVVLIDDEEDALALLMILLADHAAEIDIVGKADSVKTGTALVRDLQPDAIFLDIMMPDGTGFQLLEQLKLENTQVIFTTGHSEYAARAFEYAAVHYLLKPVDSRYLAEAVKRLRGGVAALQPATTQMQTLEHNFKNSEQCLALPNRNGFEMVKIDEIIRCEASDSYTQFILQGKTTQLISRPISYYESILSDRQFFRVHRKHLVNLKCVKSYIKGKPGYLLLQDGVTLEVSSRRREELLHALEDIARF